MPHPTTISSLQTFYRHKEAFHAALSSYLEEHPHVTEISQAPASLGNNPPRPLSRPSDQPRSQDYDYTSLVPLSTHTEFARTEIELGNVSKNRPAVQNFLKRFPKEYRIATVAKMSKEEQATGHLTDQVAKDSTDSAASTHPLHDVSTGAKEGSDTDHMKAHSANPGPVKVDKLPEPESKEALKKRAEELNK